MTVESPKQFQENAGFQPDYRRKLQETLVHPSFVTWPSLLEGLGSDIPELKGIEFGYCGFGKDRYRLSDHSVDVVNGVKRNERFKALDPEDQELALVAALLHDIAKPRGAEGAAPDPDHGIPSAAIAKRIMRRPGYKYTSDQIEIVTWVIFYDELISGYALGKRGFPRRPFYDLTPEALARGIGKNPDRKIEILDILNKEDVRVAVGDREYEKNQPFCREFLTKTTLCIKDLQPVT
ncbi:MAG: HD domain-containing protein [Patescibacteria group bacterium]